MRTLLCALLSGLVVVTGARADGGGSPISGRVFSNFYFPTTNIVEGNVQQILGSAWLQLDPKLGENSSAHLTLTADDFVASSVTGRTGFRTSIREGFVNYARSGLEFRAGKMIIPWGKSDAMNPTDFLSAKDFSVFNPDDEVRRVGGVGVWAAWTPMAGNSPLTFTFVGTPVFPQSRLLLAPGQVPSNLLGATNVQSPSVTLGNTETAFKVAYTGHEWDASLSVYRGWNHLPEFELVSVGGTATSPVITVGQTFHRIRALGADGSVTFGKWILRGESAYSWTENDTGQNPVIQPSHWDTIVGVERPIGDDFRVQAQVMARYFPQYQSPGSITNADPTLAAVFQQLAQTNALIQNYQDSFRPSGTLRVSYSNEQSGWGAEVFALGNFLGGDMLFKPQVSNRLTDALKITFGLDYYLGPASRPLGVLAAYNAVYTELKYSF